MQPFTRVTGVAAPFLAANVDTDVIMPKAFLKGVDRDGLRDGVFHDLRFAQDGQLRPDFILNRSPWTKAAFLLVGPNFGCGSSREHAVWGLGQLGIRALIGVTFGGIFEDNCRRNGLLTISLPEADHRRVAASVEAHPADLVTVDLEAQTLSAPRGLDLRFAIDPGLKASLLKGLDAIGATLEHRDAIRAFERDHLNENPWLSGRLLAAKRRLSHRRAGLPPIPPSGRA